MNFRRTLIAFVTCAAAPLALPAGGCTSDNPLPGLLDSGNPTLAVKELGGTGRTHDFYVIDCVDWVNVIARTPAGDVVLIRQYRHGTAAVHVEIPGGMVDPGEDPLVAAQRELAEETGYHAARWTRLGVVSPVADCLTVES